ncbi:DUF4340 domain-containing protein [[Clostridium] polysaccharolyticum]|uniref:DUF4340 domain-containing protein n=1 Tax=[Clostridium] polysaccharolyticum TaxID=29364 RepID=A0A1H9ZFY5_9FIRM|nr:DUF4340 domain-containing protein [[Clostridium] polysaccharolyticum]SES79742.1 protein of unknown function [[Clostridium] polysaccharolyticum]
MSKKKKKEMTTILALAVLLIAVCIAYFAVSSHNKKKEKAADTSVHLLQIDSSLVNKIEIHNEDGTAVFEKKDSEWSNPSNEKFAFKKGEIEKLLEQYSDLTASGSVVNHKDNLAEYGLEKPVAALTITLSDGTSITLSVGDNVPLSTGFYGMLSNSDGVYTFDQENISYAFATQEQFEDTAAESENEAQAE